MAAAPAKLRLPVYCRFQGTEYEIGTMEFDVHLEPVQSTSHFDAGVHVSIDPARSATADTVARHVAAGRIHVKDQARTAGPVKRNVYVIHRKNDLSAFYRYLRTRHDIPNDLVDSAASEGNNIEHEGRIYFPVPADRPEYLRGQQGEIVYLPDWSGGLSSEQTNDTLAAAYLVGRRMHQ